jgi:hypothetical protein
MSDLRPMQLGEILDGTFSIYRRHFALFMRLSMVVVWLPTAIWVYLQVRYSGTRAMEMFAAFEDHTLTAILVLLTLLVVSTAAGLLLKAGTIQVISDSYLGHDPRLAPALRLGAAKIIPLLLVALSKVLLLALIYVLGAIVVVLVVTLGRLAGTAVAILLGLAGGLGLIWFLVFVACGYGITTPVVVLEDLSSSFDAFGRSWELTRGVRLKVLGVAFVTWLISQFLPQVVAATMSVVILGASPAVQPFLVALTSLLGILLAPVMPCALTLLYYDLRVRREAFDLQVLSQELGIS